MILTGSEIKRNIKNNKIIISPFNESHITTNSYDLSLGDKIIKYTDKKIDPKIRPAFEEIKIDDKGFFLNSGDFVLGHSFERIGSDFFVPIIHGKSGIARMGLFIHVTADLIDIGSHGVITFQLYATLPVYIYPKLLIAQVSFWKTYGDISLYNGKYQNSIGPRESMIYKDFK